MKREVLFNNKWLRIVLLDGWFVASEPAQCLSNKAVAVLPYRVNESGKYEYLARFELNPAHMTGQDHQLSIITGACETGYTLHHAYHELLEEAGYDIDPSRFNYHGVVNPNKSSCTILALYSVEISDKDEQKLYRGDGSKHESKEFAKWVTREELVWAKDPYIHTIMIRMLEEE